MNTLSTTFSAVGVGPVMFIAKGQRFSYSASVAGGESFLGILRLARSRNGMQSFEAVVTATAITDATTVSGSILVDSFKGDFYRWEVTAYDGADPGPASDNVVTNLTELQFELEDTIYVSPAGNDEHFGGIGAPVVSITRALALVTGLRKTIRVAAGDYAELAPLVWPTFKGVRMLGEGSDFTSISAVGASVITVTPGVQSSTWEGFIEGVNIDHSAGAAQHGITFSNASMGKKLLFHVINCTFTADASTDKSINVATHTDASNGIRIYMSGDGTQKEIEGAIYFLAKNNGDRLNLDQLWLRGVITTSADAVPMNIRIRRCMIPKGAASAGGNAAQTITSVSSYGWTDFNNDTPEVYAAADTNDFDGSHTEVIVA